MSDGLRRELGLLDSTMVNVGTIIASGIFVVPSTIALYLHASGPMVLVWLVGGLVSLCGALAIAELGAAMPEAGGQVVYLRRAYGPLWGFLNGWTNALLINPASIAAISVGFATYLGYFFAFGAGGVKLAAVAAVVVLTLLNCLGLRLGANVQNVLTLLKIAALAGLVAAGFLLAGGSPAHLRPVWPATGWGGLAGPLGLAMIGVLATYDGWIEITYVGSEVKDPGRIIPRSILVSVLLVTVLYVLVNIAFAYVLTLPAMAHSSAVASDVARTLMGAVGGALVAAAIVVSTLGGSNGIIFTAARIPFAMAREGMFFRWAGRVHPRWGTPVPALLAQGAVAALLAASGSYDQLLNYFIFASFVFYGMGAAAVIVLRRREPDMPRPYRCWGYPVLPLVFVVCAAGFVVSTIVQTPREAAIGLGLILTGVPAYRFWARRAAAVVPAEATAATAAEAAGAGPT